MALYDQGVTTPNNSVAGGVIQPDVFGVAINWYVNRTPLLSRLPKLPTGGDSFLLTNDNWRPRSVVTTAAMTDTTGTVVTVADSSSFDVGDVLLIGTEVLLVTAIASATTLTVSRGYAASTPATHLITVNCYLITNTRTGAEIDINAMSKVPITVEQYNQTVMHAYQVGGSLQASTNYVSAYNSPLDRDKMMAIQHCVDDFETGALYGAGLKRASNSTRPLMKGIKTLLVTNKVTSPTNASAYKPSDWIRDAIQPCYDRGGQPAVIFVSTNFLTGLSVWGNYAQRIDAGVSVFGTPIDVFAVSFLPGLAIIPHPLLLPFTSFTMSRDEVRIRMKRRLFEKPRGSRGDAEEGDYIMEGAVEVDNEAHHAWVEGITAFSAT
ncbi:MAG: hypothetical protein JWN86_734 [Planctomycetota bacterium]|nr:hypothetical protein [Planctomycetota bacterium]